MKINETKTIPYVRTYIHSYLFISICMMHIGRYVCMYECVRIFFTADIFAACILSKNEILMFPFRSIHNKTAAAAD